MRLLIILSLFGLATLQCSPTRKHSYLPLSLPDRIDSLGLSQNDLHIFIDKSEYELSLMADTLEVKRYAVVFGTNPIDDKRQQGDTCTPEGDFKVKAYYKHKDWSRFIWIDYPNENSWRKFKAAQASGEIAPTAQIGGEIGIHGLPIGYEYAIEEKINWTLGCISMHNDDVDELFEWVYDGMLIRIVR